MNLKEPQISPGQDMRSPLSGLRKPCTIFWHVSHQNKFMNMDGHIKSQILIRNELHSPYFDFGDFFILQTVGSSDDPLGSYERSAAKVRESSIRDHRLPGPTVPWCLIAANDASLWSLTTS